MLVKSKRIVGLLMFVLMLTIVAGCTGDGNNTDTNESIGNTYIMKLGHDQMEGTPHHEASVKFKEIVEQRTDGKVQVAIYPAQQLGSAREMNEGLQLGTVEGVALPAASFSGFDMAIGITDLPMLFPSPEVTYKVLDGEIGDKILKRLENSGMIGAAWWSSGFKQFTGNFPIYTPDDYNGKKIRVMSHPVLIAQYEAMGANAISIDFHELYNALQQNAVDGQENPLTGIVNMRFYEVQDYITMSNHGFLGYIIAFSKSWYDTLPTEYQSIVVEAAKEVAVFQREDVHRLEAEKFLPTIEESGTTIIELEPEQRKAFEDITRPVYSKLKEQLDSEGKQLLEEIIVEIERVK